MLFILLIVMLPGCINNKSKPEDVVYGYLDSFKSNTLDLPKEIDNVINVNSDLNKEHKELYKNLLIKQYKSLEYSLISKEISGHNALVRISITVNDLRKVLDDFSNEAIKNMSNYYNEKNEFDNEKYLFDKLSYAINTHIPKDYEITFYLHKENNNWILTDPTNEDLEKIHGIYIDKHS